MPTWTAWTGCPLSAEHPGTAAVSGTSGMLGAPATGLFTLINQLDTQAEGRTGRPRCAARWPAGCASPSEAGRRIADAADLGPRRALTGDAATVDRHRRPTPGPDRRGAHRDSPFSPTCRRVGCVHRQAPKPTWPANFAQYRPGRLAAAQRVMDLPPTATSPKERARKRGITWQPAIRRHVTAKSELPI